MRHIITYELKLPIPESYTSLPQDTFSNTGGIITSNNNNNNNNNAGTSFSVQASYNTGTTGNTGFTGNTGNTGFTTGTVSNVGTSGNTGFTNTQSNQDSYGSPQGNLIQSGRTTSSGTVVNRDTIHCFFGVFYHVNTGTRLRAFHFLCSSVNPVNILGHMLRGNEPVSIYLAPWGVLCHQLFSFRAIIYLQLKLRTMRRHIESLSCNSPTGSVPSTTSLTNTGTNLTPNNNNLGTATLNVVPSVSSSSSQFGVDSGLTTANTNAALSLNPFLNQQSQSSRLSV